MEDYRTPPKNLSHNGWTGNLRFRIRNVNTLPTGNVRLHWSSPLCWWRATHATVSCLPLRVSELL